MADIERISTSSPYEPIAGYSRLVRAGDYIFVSGTTAFDERGLLVGAGQMYVQARQCLANIEGALKRVGAVMADVVRTRMFVTDISRFNDAARAHSEYFGATRPATSMVEVKALVSPQMLIEIEADVYLPQLRSAPGVSSRAAAPAKSPVATRSAPAAPKSKAKSAPATKATAKTKKRR